MSAAPGVVGILETVLYFTDQDRTERFYSDVLGLRLLDREPGRSLFYRAGDSVFLLFSPDRALEPGKLPPHGATLQDLRRRIGATIPYTEVLRALKTLLDNDIIESRTKDRRSMYIRTEKEVLKDA